MSILKEATNQTAYLKAGLLGFAGSGKTFTAKELAIGLALEASSKGKPVAFFDTETGSDFLIPAFRTAGVKLLVAKTRTFKDLLAFMREAEDVASVAIIDSITHVWNELMEAYRIKLRRTRGLEFQDWAVVKKEWRQFTDLYLTSNLHVILCGRAGYEYEMERDEETGKKELLKVGTKMKAETEMGYEPSVLIEMIRVRKSEVTKNVDDRGWLHRAFILKDRTNTLNGSEIDNPTYASFAPILSQLNLGGEHVALDTTRSSEDMFESPDRSITERKRLVDIALEEIKAVMLEAGFGGTSKDDRLAMVKAIHHYFGTRSWAEVESMRLEKLKDGLEAMKRDLLGAATPAPAPAPVEEAVS